MRVYFVEFISTNLIRDLFRIYYSSKISKELDEIKDKQLKELNEKDAYYCKAFIDLNVLLIQEYYDLH